MTWKKPHYGYFNVSDAAGLKPIKSFSSWWKFYCNVTTAGGLPYGYYLGFKEISELFSCCTVLWHRVFSLAPINVFNDRQSCHGCFALAFTRIDQ